MHSRRWHTLLKSPNDPEGVLTSASSGSVVSMLIKSFKTCIRSLKKSILTKWANLAIPERAAGRRFVGVGLFKIRKYKAKRSFRVSVCCVG